MDNEAWVMSGSLSRVIKGQFSKKIKDFHAVLFKGCGSNVARLEMYENEKAVSSGIHLFMLVCSDLMKITKVSGNSREEKHSFVLATKDQQYVFCLKNVHECHQWVEAIKEIMESLQSPATARATATAIVTAAKNKSSTVTVDNDIYDAFIDACCDYTVTVGKNTRKKLPVDGPLRLVVEDRHITIIGPGGNRVIRWNIKNLRRIGYSDHDFHVEAGRRCDSGVGYYSFDTNMGKQIYIRVEEEKLLYSNPVVKDAKETPPVPMVPSMVRNESPPLAIGGHIYEDINDLFKLDMEKLEKPVQVPPFKTKEATIALPGTKLPTENGLLGPSSDTVRPRSAIQVFSGAAKIPPLATDIYSEVREYKEAWKEHGIGDAEAPAENESQYENLDHYRPTETELKEARKRDSSPVYAKVNKSNPRQKKK